MQRLALVFLSALLIFWAFPPSTAASRLRKFYIGPDRMNRMDAEKECGRNYTYLVTVYDHQDNKELADLMSERKVVNAWIGASIGSCSTKKWSNGDDVTFNSNLTGDCGKPCCAAINANGAWESIQCSERKHFMCYEQDDGQESYNYSLISEKKSWFDAQLYCRENYTDLASIRNDEENNEVKKEGKKSNEPFWIGLLEDSVEWADGGQSAYRNWKTQKDKKPQVYMPQVYMDLKGNWHTNTDNEVHPLCYKSFIHVSTDVKTWEEALDYCNIHENATGLLTIYSQSDQTEMDRELKRKNISGPMWVGLRQSRLFGFWIWINGVTVGPWTNWKGGITPEHLISHHCGAIEKVNGQYKWTDKDCRSKLGVLCEGKLHI